ncbi:MAG TPA: demethoxyubiquinone hydroxylase family protein [Rhizomicrobium sp.]|jgi:ubiquinone biosynthesis monooxygenase Coq7|nr:demethoxyubiquinone hydroxylase family protein [Rhizomicrobium sp.]
MTRKAKPAAPGSHIDIEAMIRVDHAGEYGAVRIYQGQLAVLKRRKGSDHAVETITHMAEQEQRHLKAFDALVNERKVRPTALEPVWRIAGFALGAASAALGEKAAFACTAAVEEVIDAHYAAQITALEDGRDPPLKAVVEDFRADEAEHRDTALKQGAEQAMGYKLLSETIKAGCRIAIKLSERI